MRMNGPRTELYLRSDIACAIRAIDFTSAELSASMPIREVAIYRAGFYAALRAVSLAFDVDMSDAMSRGTPQHPRANPNMLANGSAD